MKQLKKMSIHSIDAASAQPLSRERMKAIKGGGGSCYLYCASEDGTHTSMTITSYCGRNECGTGMKVIKCTC